MSLQTRRPIRLLPLYPRLTLVLLLLAMVWAGSTQAQLTIDQVMTLNLVDAQDNQLGGLSALAWDQDERELYAISDKGYLVRMGIEGSDLSPSIKLISTHELNGEQGPLSGKRWRDAEGLGLKNHNNGIRGDSNLWISFERNPRVLVTDNQGQWQATADLDDRLSTVANFRSPNSSLEALTGNTDFGWIVGSELGLVDKHPDLHHISTLDGSKQWFFEPMPYPNSSLTGMATLDATTILILERAFLSQFHPFYIGVRQLDLKKCDAGTVCEVENLLVMNSRLHGPLDNFEGITVIDGKVWLISDDNFSSNQKTLLMSLKFE